ncbi:hypothetical protein PIB30_049483 [Stylosanthes scabra]|uniref:Uncharacterized protein n=1 Tax=Stylosanthes scabra TaxID=79078 RepID=A0ABU6QGZ9_9FABA|nr:hypothetical protein [Stylosanthes scabra]
MEEEFDSDEIHRQDGSQQWLIEVERVCSKHSCGVKKLQGCLCNCVAPVHVPLLLLRCLCYCVVVGNESSVLLLRLDPRIVDATASSSGKCNRPVERNRS